jgi:hypothetical protein
MDVLKSIESPIVCQLLFEHDARVTHCFRNVTCKAAALRASDTIRWTVNRTMARLNAPIVRCIVRSVCTFSNCKLAMRFLVVFAAVQEASRLAAEALSVMLKCDRASSRGK